MAATDDAPAPGTTRRRHERRWPMALAVLAATGLHQLLPADFKLAPSWLAPAVLLVCLLVLMVGDPGVIDQEKPWLRVMTAVTVAAIALANTFSAFRLVEGILTQATFDQDAYQLLAIGAIVWLTNNIAFALWYWDVDGGGAVRRAERGPWADPAFVFPEMHLPEVKKDWYPQFADYLALSFNTAMAFSPTDVSAVTRWAKMLLGLQSVISLTLGTLVIATAINGLGS